MKGAEVRDTLGHFAKEVGSTLNGAADSVGLSGAVERSPWLTVGAAVGLGYVLGGGLLTPTTLRILRLGAKVAMDPEVHQRLVMAGVPL